MTKEYEALQVRMRSLEEKLGLKYVPSEVKDEEAEHIVQDEYGTMNRLKRLFKWAEARAEDPFKYYEE